MIKLIIAYDHAIVRGGVKLLLAEQADIALIGEAKNGVQLMQLLHAQTCDILLLDSTIAGENGLTLLNEVKSRWPSIGVVMSAMHSDDQYAVRALRGGAAGYLTKDSAPEELIEAIRRVATGARHVPQQLVESLVASLDSGNGKPLHESLSDRELVVLCQIGAGKLVSQVAEELFLSTTTVSTYRTRVLRKLNLNTTAELIRYVVDHRLTG